MSVSGYTIDTTRPIAPSEGKKNVMGGLRRVVGSGGVGAAIGAGLGHYTGQGAGRGAALGGGLGALHGVLRGQEAAASDRTTQERMEMRRAVSDYKKEQAKKEKLLAKKASVLDEVTIRSMADEMKKIARAGGLSMVERVGEKALGVLNKVPSSLKDPKASGGLGLKVTQGLIGRGMKKGQNIQQAAQGAFRTAGRATLGAGAAVGTAGLGAAGLAMNRRRQQAQGA